MKPILLLTKNVVLEQVLQENLQRLGYEVFCTSEIFHTVMKDPEQKYLLNDYSIIILSGMISNKEVEQLCQQVKMKNHSFLRNVYQNTSLEDENFLKELGVTDCFERGCSLDMVREKLSVISNQIAKNENRQHCEKLPEKIEMFQKQLSKKEYLIFDYLMSVKEEFISREDLCLYVWDDAPNASHLSQLSVLIHKIKTKLSSYELDEMSIETVWGKGYRVSEKLIQNKNSIISAVE